jgi:hypothetical protein
MKKELDMIDLNSATFLNAAAKLDDNADIFKDHIGIADKQDYIRFRDALKASINESSGDQVELRKLTREVGGNGYACWKRSANRPKITALISLRRAGKVWSVAQAERARQESVQLVHEISAA